MAYKVEKFTDESIVLVTFENDFEFEKHGRLCAELVEWVLDNQAQPVYVIHDMSESTWHFDDVVVGASLVTRQSRLFQHPRVLDNVLVTRDSLLALATKGMNSFAFGNVSVKVAASLVEALEYIRDAGQREGLTLKKAS